MVITINIKNTIMEELIATGLDSQQSEKSEYSEQQIKPTPISHHLSVAFP
jgi:hypothetical protein